VSNAERGWIAGAVCISILFALILRAGYVAHRRMDTIEARVALAEQQAAVALSMAASYRAWTNVVVQQDAMGGRTVSWLTNRAEVP